MRTTLLGTCVLKVESKWGKDDSQTVHRGPILWSVYGIDDQIFVF